MRLEIGGFVFTEKGVRPAGEQVRPTRAGYTAAMEMALQVAHASQYWPGDLELWLDEESGWNDDVVEQLRSERQATQTTYNRRSVAKRVGPEARALAPTFSHAAAVASLEPTDQLEVLREAVDERLNAHQTRKRAKRRVRPRVAEGQAELQGRYRVIYTNPDWLDDDGHGLTITELSALPVAAHAQPNSVLFIWVPNSLLLAAPGPRDVIDAWGFKYETTYVWDKVRPTETSFSSMHHGTLVVASRGVCTPDVSIDKHKHASIFRERSEGVGHRPQFARRLIESLYTHGPYLELFGRGAEDGWTVFGSDPKLWKVSA